MPPPGFASSRGKPPAPNPALTLSETKMGLAFPILRSAAAADAPSEPGPAPGPDSSEFILAQPFSPAEATPSAPHAPLSAPAPDNRVPSPMEKKPDTWRLRL